MMQVSPDRFKSNDRLATHLAESRMGPIEIKSMTKDEMNKTWYPNFSNHANKVKLIEHLGKKVVAASRRQV